jgi:hypothetical protein
MLMMDGKLKEVDVKLKKFFGGGVEGLSLGRKVGRGILVF